MNITTNNTHPLLIASMAVAYLGTTLIFSPQLTAQPEQKSTTPVASPQPTDVPVPRSAPSLPAPILPPIPVLLTPPSPVQLPPVPTISLGNTGLQLPTPQIPVQSTTAIPRIPVLLPVPRGEATPNRSTRAVGPITGTGTTGNIAKFTGPNAIGNSVMVEKGGKLGLGTTAPTGSLSVVANATSSSIYGSNAGAGAAVQAVSKGGIGVQGETNSTSNTAVGVLGRINPAAPGISSAGVRGINNSTNTKGYGVYGSHAGGGSGVYGTSVSGNGISGTSTSGTALYGTSAKGTAVLGETSSTLANAVAVQGVIKSTGPGDGSSAVRGINSGTNGYGFGVYGTHAGSGVGVVGTVAGAGYGVYGVANSGTGIVGQGANGVSGTASTGTGVVGSATSTGNGVVGSSDTGYGVYATSNKTGVYAKAVKYGVLGETSNGYGVYGLAPSGTGVVGQGSNGVSGVATNGNGVVGSATSGNGVVGSSNSGTGVSGKGGRYGVLGESSNNIGVSASSNNYVGLLAATGNASSYAGYFYGNVYVEGSLSKASGSFKIDHPLHPSTEYLSHSFVESPDMMNVYNGNATLDSKGQVLVTLPAYFQALNRDFRYQLTPIGAPASLYIAQKISANQFKIAGGKPGLEVSWQVTGIRNDAYAREHRIKVEETKVTADQGKYLYPAGFGAGNDKRIGPNVPRLAAR